jgi:uncharacterized protein (UPF0335 family)
MATDTSNMIDTINSMEMLIKSMASSMKNMEATIKALETKVEGIERLETDVRDVMDSVSAIYARADNLEFSMEKLTARSIKNAEEAAKPAFRAICRELLQLAISYSKAPENPIYRDKITVVSNFIAPSSSLRSFLVLTSELTLEQAQQLINDNKIGFKQLFRSYVTPARLIALKGLLLFPRRDKKWCPLEYRSLIGFITDGCDLLEMSSARKGLIVEDGFVYVVEQQLAREQMKLQLRHGEEKYFSVNELNVDKMEAAAIERGGECINGFKDLVPEYSPDPENIEFVRDQLKLVCRCHDCV